MLKPRDGSRGGCDPNTDLQSTVTPVKFPSDALMVSHRDLYQALELIRGDLDIVPTIGVK